MNNEIETTPEVAQNEEELILKVEEKPEPVELPNFEEMFSELEKKLEEIYMSKDEMAGEVEKQIKAFFANNVVVRGKKTAVKSKVENSITDIKNKIKARM